MKLFSYFRFLNKAGEFTKPEYFVPFGHGEEYTVRLIKLWNKKTTVKPKLWF